MLAGKAVVAIWNGIAPEGRAEFYAWHLHEHMPERAAIPGFLRGRRYIALDPATHPEFFTLYEAETFSVLEGRGYRDRLDAPTPWTRAATSHFQDTSRALARVLHSTGPGQGGVMLTVRFAGGAEAALADALQQAARLPRVAGAHLCLGDAVASGAGTAESAGRTDIRAAPDRFIMIEATDAAALAAALPDSTLTAAGAAGPFLRGRYRLEYLR